MGSNDIPPPHVTTQFMLITNACLQLSGTLWTISYALQIRQSFRDRTYSMPMFALAFNFAWEIIFGLIVTDTWLEQLVFSIWLLMDIFLVYGLFVHGKEEWNHTPWVKKNLKPIFVVLTAWCLLIQLAFAKWWLDNEISKKEGKIFKGVVQADTTELIYWTALLAQINLSAWSLIQLFVRQSTRGVSLSIW